MNSRNLWNWIYKKVSNHNLFILEEDDYDDDALKDPAAIVKKQKYKTWLYIGLLTVCFYILFYATLTRPQSETLVISNVKSDTFDQLYSEYGQTFACPCSTVIIPYSNFISNNWTMHPICSSIFVSLQWVEGLYFTNASSYMLYDFRKVAYSQFELLSKLCSISEAIISQIESEINNTELVTINVLSKTQIQLEVDSKIEFQKNNAYGRIISFLNYWRTTIQRNFLVSALGTNWQIYQWYTTNPPTLAGTEATYFIESLLFSKKCGVDTFVLSAFLPSPSNDSEYVGQRWPFLINYVSVHGFFAACTPLDALLQSTMDCLYESECMQWLLNYFPNLNQTNFNWSSSILSAKHDNKTVLDYFQTLFIESWISNTNYSAYFDQCSPSKCTYSTTTRAHLSYAITFLISLYGGLIIILRLFVSYLIDILFKFLHHQKHASESSGEQSLYTCKLVQLLKQLNLFKNVNHRTESSLKQQRIITRVYLILLIGSICVLCLFNSLSSEIATTAVSNPSLATYNLLEMKYSTELRCPCANKTMSYRTFISLSPVLHQICSSGFVTNDWIYQIMSNMFIVVSYDWRLKAYKQFQILSDLCQLANATIDAAMDKFLSQLFVASSVLSEMDFDQQLNATLSQFYQSTAYSFALPNNIIQLIQKTNQYHEGFASQNMPPNYPDSALIFNSVNSQVYFRLYDIQDATTGLITCVCAINPYCQRPAILNDFNLINNYNSWYGYGYNHNLSGWVERCLAHESLLLSTLECLYINSSCFPFLLSYITKANTDALSLLTSSSRLRPLTYDPAVSRFPPNTPISIIVNEMMLETWNAILSYEKFYESCAPLYCSYSQSVRKENFLGVIIVLVSAIGGIIVSLRIITPHLVHFTLRILARTNEKSNQSEQGIVTTYFLKFSFFTRLNISSIHVSHSEIHPSELGFSGQIANLNEYIREEVYAIILVRRSCADRLKMIIQNVIKLLYNALTESNIFSSRDVGSDVDRMTAKNYGQWATRLYMILFISSLSILVFYTIIQPHSVIKNFEQPSFTYYNRLKDIYGDGLKCSCSRIASTYSDFVSIQPAFHPICSSQFVSNEWRVSLTDGLVANLSIYERTDYRRFLSAHLQYLQGLCQLSIDSANNSIHEFLTSLLVITELLPKDNFDDRLTSLIEQSKLKAPTLLSTLLLFTQSIIHGNAFQSTYGTNFQYIYVDGNVALPEAEQAFIYDDDCSCDASPSCTTQASFIQANSSQNASVKGMKMGCTPSESLLASTLECFYDQSCLDLIQNYTHSRNSSSPLSTTSSRFSQNTTVDELRQNLFIEEWSTAINYSSYYAQCSPSVCSYTSVAQFNILYTITLILGLQGGLTIVLKWICPKLVRIGSKIYYNRKKLASSVHPVDVLEMSSIMTNNIVIQNTTSNLENRPMETLSQKNFALRIRWYFKTIFIVVSVICLLVGIAIFSIYYGRQGSTTTTPISGNLNAMLTTITPTISGVSGSTCQLKVKRQSINIQCPFSNTSVYRIADVNNDNRVDLIFCCDNSSTVNVLLANSNGSFGEVIPTYLRGDIIKIYVDDMNNDGIADLIVLCYIQYLDLILFLFGNGDGTFQLANIPYIWLITSPVDVSVADINKDNVLDVTVTFRYFDAVYVFYGYGNGSFSSSSMLFIELTSDPQQLAVGDFDNDGYTDLAVLNGRSLHIHVFLRNSNGSFPLPTWLYTAYDINQYRMLAGDFDNDYQSDIVYLHSWENTELILYRYNNGAFHTDQQIVIGTSVLLNSKSIVIHDINNDNYSDIIIGSLLSDEIYGLLADGSGHFQTQTFYSSLLINSSYDINDFDHSSCHEIINMNIINSTLYILFNACQCPT
ncbi:unnamed protein product [Adineta ricciae]|uniref:Uncharacterized protein n=2 Tax=Adineta ricciae TaxID=249248 RepID=A0A815DTJ3_ADIRI|nr:unnamed protein product [Adineta ricciae]